MDRRDFLKNTVAGGVGLGMLGAAGGAQAAQGPAPGGKVPRRQLGATGADVPILLMGGTQKFDDRYDKTLHRAFELGVDYIDTAREYAQGQAQKTIGTFMKQVGDRKKMWVTSKATLVGADATPEGFRTGVDQCLEGLETDYLDMFFMHMITDERLFGPDFIRTSEELKKAGKIRFFGFSCHDGNSAELMAAAAKMGGGVDAIMFRYNFREYGDVALNKAIDACKAAGIGLIAMKTQASVPADLDAVVEFRSQDFTLGQAKLKAVWADERIDAAVSAMTNVNLVTENTAAAMSPVKLSMNEFMQLNRLAALTAHAHCLGCKQRCEPRANGLRIADTLRYLMYHECYGETDEARALYRALPRKARDFKAIDLSEATAACPQGIRIAERLAQARHVLTA